MKKTLLSWSSGKDSAWALHVLQQQADVDVVGLFTTVNETFDRVAMHAVRRELLQHQARRVGLPLEILPIPYPCSNAQYEAVMADFVGRAREQQVDCLAFGDLFLEDIRRYREHKLAGSGLTPVFPLWGLATRDLARQMIDGGLRAILTCVDPRQLPPRFCGRDYDLMLLQDLPDGVDPCGERGEFHSFVFDGPMFLQPLDIQRGATVDRDGFVFTDIVLERSPSLLPTTPA